MARKYRKVDVDFDALDTALSALEAPTIGLEEILARLRDRLAEKRGQGVPLAALSAALKQQGVVVGERPLAHFLDTGKLPETRKSRPQDAAPPDPGGPATL